MTETEAEYSDVLIVGAGISGIGAAYRIHEKNPGLSYTVLERRERIGGTWDLFRYPGVRSDSDIFTLSFPFEPWTREGIVKLLILCGGCEDWSLWRLRRGTRATGIRSRSSGTRCGCITVSR
jgi:cation diffusion facilitator CzcD-associated flavoprotein CzcO